MNGISDELPHLRRLILRDLPPDAEIVVLEQHGDSAVAVVRLMPRSAWYWQVVLVHEQGAWRDSNSGNSPGWTATSEDKGVWTVWDAEAPSSSVTAVVKFLDGVEVEAAVRDGFYFIARWDVPDEMVESMAPRPPVFRA